MDKSILVRMIVITLTTDVHLKEPEDKECIFEIEFKSGESYQTDYFIGEMHDGFFYINIIHEERSSLYKHDSCNKSENDIRVMGYCLLEVNND